MATDDAEGSGGGPGAGSPPGLDLPAAGRWLGDALPALFHGTARARLIAGGRSNLTYLVDGDDGHRVVLRRPPLGHVLRTAHDMAREYRVIRALAGTSVPVPQALGICTDPAVIGAPFYVMSFVEGLVPRTPADIAGFTAAGREELVMTMMDVLADLHAVDVDAVGLADFGQPAGFLGRQVRRWSAQLDASRSRDLEGIDRLRDGLAGSLPATDTTPSGGGAGPGGRNGDTGARAGAAGCLVHGDFRLDNLIVSEHAESDPPTVRAVLDWEMSTLGDPLADLGLLLAYWDGLGSMPDPAVAPIGPRAGLPPGDALTARYAARSGTDLSSLPWYVALGFFKIAVILEGIHFRFVQGQTVGTGFARIGSVVPDLVRLGLDTLASAPRPD